MDQYDILQVGNNLNEFNVDTYSKKMATASLLLGDFSKQNKDYANIAGGNMIADDFYLKSNDFDATHLYLTNSNASCNVTFSNINLPTWVFSNIQKRIMISNFSNDDVYVNSTSFNYDDSLRNTFIFDESIIHLMNRHSFNDIALAYGYNGFLVSASNFQDALINDDILSNLNIGNVSKLNSVNTVIANLLINYDLKMPFITNNNETYVGKRDDTVINIPYTFPKLTHSNLSNNTATIYIPTSKLIYDTFSNFSNDVIINARCNIEFITTNKVSVLEYLNDDSIITKSSNLYETNKANTDAYNSNLSLGNIAFQNSNDATFDNVLFSNIYCVNHNVVYYREQLMKYDSFINTTNPGFVTLSNTISFNKASNKYNAFQNSVNSVTSEIKGHFDDFSNDVFNSNENLLNISDVFMSRVNLGIHASAFSGRLIDLHDRPLYLSELNNDTNYIAKYNSLSDLDSVTAATKKIGLFSMAFIDAKNPGGNVLRPSTILGSNCIIDFLFLDEGTLRLKEPSIVDRNFDFLYLISKASSFGKYDYERLKIADSSYMASEYYTDLDRRLRVKLNDLSNYYSSDLMSVVGYVPPPIGTITDMNNVPTAKFTYDKIIEMSSNILTQFEIPFKYYNGWL